MEKPIFNEKTGNYLYIATDIYKGDLVGVMWAKNEDEALDYFFNCYPPLTADPHDLHVEVADENEYSLEELVSDDAELADGTGVRVFSSMPDPDLIIDDMRFGRGITESYRRITSRGSSLNDNPLFVDFE